MAVGLAVALGPGAKGASAYTNPTAGAALVLQIPGMHLAQVRRDQVYTRRSGSPLRLDVYRPRAAGARRLPAVLVGGPWPRAGKDSGQKVGWAQAIAASGLAAVAFDTRSDNYLETPYAPARDVLAALTYVRRNAARLGIDGSRLCTLGFSIGTAPWHLWAAMAGPAPGIRSNVVFYGPLDLHDLEFEVDAKAADDLSAVTYLRRDGGRIAPMLVAKAGLEGNPGINESIDRVSAEARRVGAPVEVVTHERGGHGFDVGAPAARSRAVVRRALAFFRSSLLGT